MDRHDTVAQHRQKTNQQTDETSTVSKHYAAGVYRRLAEQHSNERHHDLTDYNHQPTIDEIVTDMVEHGYDEETARSSAQTLFDDEIYSTPS